MEMRIVETSDEYAKIALVGRLDTQGAEGIDPQFAAATTDLEVNVVLDFSGVSFIASMGFRMLISAAKTVARNGSKMVVYGAQDFVKDIFLLSAMDTIIPLVSSEDDAVALLDT